MRWYYTRFSSLLQSAASIEDQERLCRERAEREGWEVVALFADRALSGASMLRPGLQALLQAASDGSVDVVLTEALDRLTREPGRQRGTLQASEVRGHAPCHALARARSASCMSA